LEQLDAPHAPATQTSPAPQTVPSGTLAPVSPQAAAPVLQLVAPTWHALLGVHAPPAVHPTQAPPLQTRFVPHALPFAAFAPVSRHVDVPVLQSVVPTWQTLFGVHALPAVQATHAPALHTRSVPHAWPFRAFAPVSVHTATPLLQAVVPTWHAFLGVHARPFVHAAHTPFAQ
jgi:hypothetical protein